MQIVVTRHPALVELLVERGIVRNDARVISHATPDDIRGMDVIGNLPLRLAVMARTITDVPIVIPPDLRGAELDIHHLREFVGEATTYVVAENSLSDAMASWLYSDGFIHPRFWGGTLPDLIERSRGWRETLEKVQLESWAPWAPEPGEPWIPKGWRYISTSPGDSRAGAPSPCPRICGGFSLSAPHPDTQSPSASPRRHAYPRPSPRSCRAA